MVLRWGLLGAADTLLHQAESPLKDSPPLQGPGIQPSWVFGIMAGVVLSAYMPPR